MSPRRRRAALAIAACAGLASGGGFALWRARSGLQPADEAVAPDLWRSTFEAPSGPRVAMSRFAGRPLVLNFWATWCAPCVTEMPLLDTFARMQKATSGGGVQVLALAIDQTEPVRRFLADRSLGLTVALGGAGALDLSRSLGNSAGGLPFSVAFASNGSVLDKRLGVVSEELLLVWAKRLV